MNFGTFLLMQSPSARSSQEIFARGVEMAQAAETLGFRNVWLGEHAWLVVLHLATGALLWVSLVYFTLLVVGAPAPAEAGARRKTSVQPVTA